MTTLRDILNDLANDVLQNDVFIGEDRREKDEIVDEYIELIKERLIG